MEISKNKDLNEQNKSASPSKFKLFLNKEKWLIVGLIVGVGMFVHQIFFFFILKDGMSQKKSFV